MIILLVEIAEQIGPSGVQNESMRVILDDLDEGQHDFPKVKLESLEGLSEYEIQNAGVKLLFGGSVGVITCS